MDGRMDGADFLLLYTFFLFLFSPPVFLRRATFSMVNELGKISRVNSFFSSFVYFFFILVK